MRNLLFLIFVFGVVTGSAVLLHTIVGPFDDAGWHIGIYAFVWVYATITVMKYREARRLFTYFVQQGYTEKAADEGAVGILSIRRFAKRKQPKIDKERQEFERLRKKFDPSS